MHQRKSKKILIYFFLLVIFGTINNFNLNQIKFDKIQKINVSGLKNSDNQILLKKIKDLNLENIFFINKNEISRILDSNTLVENYKIFKKYPSTLDIKIKKTVFLAKINLDGEEFLIGSNKKLSKKNLTNLDLPYIFGKPNIEEFFKFKQIIDNSKISYKQIKSMYYFHSKRWDIELNNNILIKLSKENTKNSLDNAIMFLNENALSNIKMVDSRIKNQIIINE